MMWAQKNKFVAFYNSFSGDPTNLEKTESANTIERKRDGVIQIKCMNFSFSP